MIRRSLAIVLALVLALGACVAPPQHEHEPLVRRVEQLERERERTQEGLRRLQAALEKQGEEVRRASWWRIVSGILSVLLRRGR